MPNRTLWILIAFAAAAPLVHAQWLNHRTPGIPRTPDGKPNLSAPTPRAADGKPNLSGLWQTDSAPPEMLELLIPGSTNGAGEEPLSQYFINILSDFKPDEAPIRPDAAAYSSNARKPSVRYLRSRTVFRKACRWWRWRPLPTRSSKRRD